MLKVEKMENKRYTIYKFYFEYFGKKPLVAIIFDKVLKTNFILYETKEFLSRVLNIKNFEDLDKISKVLDRTIRCIVRKHLNINIREDYEIDKKITFIIKELEEFLKDFLLLQSI